mgnify:CR=1 FL=1
MTAIDVLLRQALASGLGSAASLEIGDTQGALHTWYDGRLSADASAALLEPDDLFDLASLTKVMATTAVALRLSEEGRLHLEDAVGAWVPAWHRRRDRSSVTIVDLLAHQSGLPAHQPLYRIARERHAYVEAICDIALAHEPRAGSIYSDLGFILLVEILERAGGRPFRSQVRDLLRAVGAAHTDFLPSMAARARSVATGFDAYRRRVLHGEVHDPNAWALGGVAGHAGLFGCAADVGAFARAILKGLLGGSTPIASSDRLRAMARRAGAPGSSRALGWDTMLPTSSCGERMSTAAIGHTGFTGTSLWIDPTRELYVVLLTNRVATTSGEASIRALRRAVHDAALDAFDRGVLRARRPS